MRSLIEERRVESFVAAFAGVPVRINCRFAENRAFLQDYITSEAPVFAVEPTQADLRRMQADFDRADRADGLPQHRRSDMFLENNAIHALLAERFVQYGVLLMHGSALCMDGEAYLFTASSGTGKSTHARLWREVFGDRVWMINDDKPLLRVTDAGVTVWGSPWNGKHRLGKNASAPLRAVVSLHRDRENHIEPLKQAAAFSVLVKQIYSSKDPATMAQIMALEKRLLDRVDFYALGCNMEPDAAQIAWEGMQRKAPEK